MPTLEVADIAPERFIGFNEVKTFRRNRQSAGVHFFLDDYQFERVWTNPQRYISLLSEFAAVCSPDFSLYADMPVAMQIWNTYRSRAVGQIWNRSGIKIIPTVSWSTPDSYAFCFEGLPTGSVVAISSQGVIRYRDSFQWWIQGAEEMVQRLAPRKILLYGKPVEFDAGDSEIISYAPRCRTTF